MKHFALAAIVLALGIGIGLVAPSLKSANDLESGALDRNHAELSRVSASMSQLAQSIERATRDGRREGAPEPSSAAMAMKLDELISSIHALAEGIREQGLSRRPSPDALPSSPQRAEVQTARLVQFATAPASSRLREVILNSSDQIVGRFGPPDSIQDGPNRCVTWSYASMDGRPAVSIVFLDGVVIRVAP